MEVVTWTCKPFEQLTLTELYDLLALRAEVFVVEQDCPYQDLDGKKDYHSHHLMGYRGDTLMAYARIVTPGISYTEPSIGRIVTSPKARRTGLGMQLMDEAISLVQELYHTGAIRISAQCYLKEFYQRFGFEQVGEPYLEDNIPHIQMLRTN